MSGAVLEVNGRSIPAAAPPRRHLGDWLREDLGLTGVHLGCEHGVCGACTVEIDGAPARACITFPSDLDGARVRTIEGFDDDALMMQLRKAFSAEHALQCGFCTPGMLIAAREAVRRAPGPDAEWIRREMAGNLCRCTGYVGIVRAIAHVIAERPAATPTRLPCNAADRAGPHALPVFVPLDSAPAPAARPVESAAPSDDAGAAEGGHRLQETFIVHRPVEAVWEALADLPLVARCFAGATLTDHVADRVSGELEVKLGPIRAAFRGAATIERDDARRLGIVRGGGQDGRSASRTRAEIAYSLVPISEGETRVDLAVAYRLTGPLAQFSRGGIVKSLAGTIVSDFADRLNAALAGPDAVPPPSPRPVSLAAMLWRTFLRRLRGSGVG